MEPCRSCRILVLTPDLPYPHAGGGQMRMSSVLDALGSRHVVHVVARAPALPAETAQWCQRHGCSITCLARKQQSLPGRIINRLRIIFTGSELRWDADEQARLDREYAAFRPDLVWVEAGYQILYALRWRDRVPVVVDFWGTSEGAERVLRQARGVARLWHRYHCLIAHRNERNMVPRLSAAVVVSDHLAAHLRHVVHTGNIVVVPTALVDSSPRAGAPPRADPDTMIMTGAMAFEPNVDAARFLVREILPRIRQRRPHVRVVLAGGSPSRKVRELARPGQVEVTGFVADLQTRIACAAVYVLPMRLGSGIRTKLLEVFPTGTPIVTTAIGAEGYDLRHGENCLVAETPAAFADACVQLLLDKDLALRIGRNAQRLAREVYTQAVVRDSVAVILRECLGALSTAKKSSPFTTPASPGFPRACDSKRPDDHPDACPVCHETPIARQHTYTSPGYAMYYCTACDLIFSHPMKNVGKAWYEACEWYSFEGRRTDLRWHEKVFLARRPNLGQGLLLNIGCGKNDFLKQVEKTGYQVVAVDFNEHAIRFTREQLGIRNAYTADIFDFSTRYTGAPFEIVLLFEVFEHLPNPAEVMTAIARIIRPGGYLIASVPNRNRIRPQANEWDYPPHHLTRWSAESLARFMQRHGFSVESMQSKPITDEDMIGITGLVFALPRIEKAMRETSGLRHGILQTIHTLLLGLRISFHMTLAGLARIFTREGTNLIVFARRTAEEPFNSNQAYRGLSNK